MTTCPSCMRWVTKRVTDYEDGSEVVNYQAPDGKGTCLALSLETPATFGCNQHAEAAGDDHSVIRTLKSGAPWQHFVMTDCPDCAGKGSNASEPDATGFVSSSKCERCQGTGKVRLYDDGHVGEETTRMHPKELETWRPFCDECARKMEREWVSCPYCGRAREMPAATQVVVLDENIKAATRQVERAIQN